MPKPTSITIGLEHQKVHEGVSFTWTYLWQGVVNNGFVRVQIKAISKSLHIILGIEASGKSYWSSYGGTTYVDDGILESGFNRIVGGGLTQTAEVYRDPVVDVLGASRGVRLIPAGTGGNATGGATGARIESIVPAGNNLLFEVQNVSGQARDIGIFFDWYEENRDGMGG